MLLADMLIVFILLMGFRKCQFFKACLVLFSSYTHDVVIHILTHDDTQHAGCWTTGFTEIHIRKLE